MITDAERARYPKEIAFKDATGEASNAYERAIVAQINRAEGSPDQIRLQVARTAAEKAALDAIVVNLQKQLPEVKIVMEPRKTFPGRPVHPVKIGAMWRLPRRKTSRGPLTGEQGEGRATSQVVSISEEANPAMAIELAARLPAMKITRVQ
jgi:hypothetical protein